MGLGQSDAQLACGSFRDHRAEPSHVRSSRGQCGALLPDPCGADLRNLDTSAAAANSGSRSALARLLTLVDPAGAEHHAHRLLDVFGSLSRLIRTEPWLIDSVLPAKLGAGELIGAATAVVAEAKRSDVFQTKVRTGDSNFQAFLIDQLSAHRVEVLLAIYLDASGAHIGDHLISLGTPADIPVGCRELFGRAFLLDAAGLILAHNHPSGDVNPSVEDLEVTRELIEISNRFEIRLVDHLVVADGLIYSMSRSRCL